MCFARFTPFAALLVVFLAFSEVAKAECGDLPKVSWWGDLTHGKIARYVEAKHGWSGRPTSKNGRNSTPN